MVPTLDPSGLLTTQELADYLKVPRGTLHQWRSRGEGPPGFRVGRHVRYRAQDVEAWLSLQAQAERRASARAVRR